MKYLILIALLALGGCASTPGQGQEGVSFTVTDRTYDQVWEASAAVLARDLNHVDSRTDKRNGILKAVTQASLTSWGEYVTVQIRAGLDDPGTFTVMVVSQKAVKYQRSGNKIAGPIATAIQVEINQQEGS